MFLVMGLIMDFTEIQKFIDLAKATGEDQYRRKCFEMFHEEMSLVQTIQNPPYKNVCDGGWTKYCREKRPDMPSGNKSMALATGPFNKLIALDIDNNLSFDTYCKEKNVLVDMNTTVVKTGKGKHVWYQYPQDGHEYSSKCFKEYGFDIRGLGGCIICPGSLHDNGNTYEFISTLPPAPAPEWLLDLCRKESLQPHSATQNPFLEDKESLQPHPATQNPFLEDVEHETIDLDTLDEKLKQDILATYVKSERSEILMSILIRLRKLGHDEHLCYWTLKKYPIGERIAEKEIHENDYFHKEYESAGNFIILSGGKIPRPKKEKPQKQSENLFQIMMGMDYFVDGENRYYARYSENDEYSFLDVHENGFQGLVLDLFSKKFNSLPDLKFMKTAFLLLEKYLPNLVKPIQTIHRFGEVDGALYLNLGGHDKKAVRITASKYEVFRASDVVLKVFTEPKQIADVSMNCTGLGTTHEFLEYLGFSDENVKDYLIVTLLSYLYPKIPAPILYLYAPFSMGKTNIIIALKSVFDPFDGGYVVPKKVQDMAVALSNSGVGYFDNFQKLPSDVQDAFCLAYSNGYHVSRKNYTNGESYEIPMKCPLMLSATKVADNLADDFRSRVTFIGLKPMKQRIAEIEFRKKIDAFLPRVRGELCNLMSEMLPIIKDFEPTNMTRHADFDLLIQAYYSAIGKAPFENCVRLNKWKLQTDSRVLLQDEEIMTLIEMVKEKGFMFFTPKAMCNELSDVLDAPATDYRKFGEKLRKIAPLIPNFDVHLFAGERTTKGKLFLAVSKEYAIANQVDLRELTDESVVTEYYKASCQNL